MKGRIAAVMISVLLWTAVPASADEPSAETPSEARPVPLQIGVKLARGAANFVTGWVEVPKQIYLVGNKEGWLMGSFRGPIDGLGMFVARTVAGVYEVVTFPLPIPPQYQPMLKPEYVWQPDPGQSGPEPDSAESAGESRPK
jgi:putative exosortase-associated protein (TIGR04073 family)